MSELDRLKEQLIYVRFWQRILVVTEIALVGWLIATPIGTNRTLWFIATFVALSFAVAIYLVHTQVDRRMETGSL